MTGPNERDEIAAVLAGHHEDHAWIETCICEVSIPDDDPEGRFACHLADLILASDWLAERDRRTAAKAVREAADWMNSAEFKQPEASRYINESHWNDAIVDACDALELRARQIEADQ